jgi:hypothetical protein
MSHIEVGQPLVVLINTLEVEPTNQQRLVNLLIEATESVMCKLPGFVSANIHASLDGTQVTNYAQWRSVEEFEAMLANPEVYPHFAEVRAIAKPQRGLYRVVYTKEVTR